MPFVRVSYMVARPGQEALVAEQLQKLSAHYAGQPGYIQGYFLTAHEGGDPRRMGRVGIWESESAAVDAAQTSTAMALRSELLRLLEDGSDVELTFDGAPDIS